MEGVVRGPAVPPWVRLQQQQAAAAGMGMGMGMGLRGMGMGAPGAPATAGGALGAAALAQDPTLLKLLRKVSISSGLTECGYEGEEGMRKRGYNRKREPGLEAASADDEPCWQHIGLHIVRCA